MRVVVTGTNGQVGREVVGALEHRGHDVVRWGGGFDVSARHRILEQMRNEHPEAVVHAAAWTDVDGCETDRERAHRSNGLGTRNVMDAARDVGAYVVYVSTDYVFDGEKASPYVETDPPHPLSVYGMSKLAGEQAIDAESAIVRTSWVVSARRTNMLKTVLRLRSEGRPLRFVTDQRGYPTIAADLAGMLCTFVEQRYAGIWHVTNQGAVSWYEFARAVMEIAGDDPEQVDTDHDRRPRPAPRGAPPEKLRPREPPPTRSRHRPPPRLPRVTPGSRGPTSMRASGAAESQTSSTSWSGG